MKGKHWSGTSTDSGSDLGMKRKGKGKDMGEDSEIGRRRKVEHWVPAIWIPDEKTSACMRCGRPFGWRRRRHHCRLCGRCVCAGCSGTVSRSIQTQFFSILADYVNMIILLQTFFISDPTTKEESKPARACDACYETVFPVIDAPRDELDSNANNTNHRTINSDTLGTLSGFPSWLSMPVMPVASNPVSVPQALMAIDLDEESKMVFEDPKGRARVRSRPRSYHQILEDFSQEDQDKENRQGRERQRFDVVNVPLEEGDDDQGEGQDDQSEGNEVNRVDEDRPALSSLSSSPRKENTAKRIKRFSLPAVAVQTTSVTARTGFSDVDQAEGGEAKMNTRFSLVLGGGHRRGHSGGKSQHNVGEERIGDGDNRRTEREIGTSVAASRLSELLGRRK